jgi:hypothetical protein
MKRHSWLMTFIVVSIVIAGILLSSCMSASAESTDIALVEQALANRICYNVYWEQDCCDFLPSTIPVLILLEKAKFAAWIDHMGVDRQGYPVAEYYEGILKGLGDVGTD